MAAADITNSAQHWMEARIASGTVIATPTVTGAKTGNPSPALASLLTALANLGVIVDSTSA